MYTATEKKHLGWDIIVRSRATRQVRYACIVPANFALGRNEPRRILTQNKTLVRLDSKRAERTKIVDVLGRCRWGPFREYRHEN